MPCIKCPNGLWKYGEHGNCQFDSEEKCHEAEAAIHAEGKKIKFLEAIGGKLRDIEYWEL